MKNWLVSAAMAVMLGACGSDESRDAPTDESADTSESAVAVDHPLVGSWRIDEPQGFKLALMAGPDREYYLRCTEGACKGDAIRASYVLSKQKVKGGMRRFITFGLFPPELTKTPDARWHLRFRYRIEDGRIHLTRADMPEIVLKPATLSLCGADRDCVGQGHLADACSENTCVPTWMK